MTALDATGSFAIEEVAKQLRATKRGALTSMFAVRYDASKSDFNFLMTPEERARMNELCTRIQEEQDYESFSATLHEMSELIERKEQRRFPNQPKVVWARNKPWISMPASANKIVSSVDGPKRKVEISVSGADDLFREIRIENSLIGVDGRPVALTAGARLTLTLEAETNGTLPNTEIDPRVSS